jgi:sensor histidine kinase regulating citrate/malate metabolism
MEAVLKVKKGKRKIYFSIFDESNRVFVTVKDTGPGIPDEIKDRVFEKGFTTKKDEDGGYGLYLVKSLVESYNGEIYFDSVLGRGTEFTVNLPN